MGKKVLLRRVHLLDLQSPVHLVVGGVPQLQQALAGLGEDHRTVILLREADGLSYKQIAVATGVSIGTVMSRLFYAKRKLRKLLAEQGVTL